MDDITLIAAHDNDLTLSNATWSAQNLGQPGSMQLPCTVYAESELCPLNFRGVITNNASLTQTNVHLQVLVDGPGGDGITLNAAAVRSRRWKRTASSSTPTSPRWPAGRSLSP